MKDPSENGDGRYPYIEYGGPKLSKNGSRFPFWIPFTPKTRYQHQKDAPNETESTLPPTIMEVLQDYFPPGEAP